MNKSCAIAIFPSVPARALLLTLFLVTLLPAQGHAAWPRDPSQNVKVTPSSTGQGDPVMTTDGVGGAIIAWVDTRSGPTSDIYAQRISVDGIPMWTSGGSAICTAVGNQGSPVITSDGMGGAIVAWTDDRNGGFANLDIYAQRVNAAGVAQWTSDGVAMCTAAGQQFLGGIGSDGTGAAVMVWQDKRLGAANSDIYAQRVQNGTTQWGANGLAICTAAFTQETPVLVCSQVGTYIAWSDMRAGVDIYAQLVDTFGTIAWAANGVAICTVAGNQDTPAITLASGSAIVAWRDGRVSLVFPDIYAQKVNSSGVVQWAAGGVAVCTAADAQWRPVIISDGSDGAIIVWDDSRSGTSYQAFAQRMNASGVAQWAANGLAVSQQSSYFVEPRLVIDGSGGAIVCWHHDFNSNPDIYAQRLNGSGTPQWLGGPLVVSNAPGTQYRESVTSDGNGGVIMAWPDSRTGSDVYAQNIVAAGCLGGTAPVIATIRDVPNDQGGRVKVSWECGGLDVVPSPTVESYWVWRSAPPNLIEQAMAEDALPAAGHEVRLGSRLMMATGTQAAAYYWEYIASQPAGHLFHYSFVAPTTSDSIGASNPYTAFMIQARTTGGAQWWYSAPDSGYSVDNIPPSPPSAFSAQYFPGSSPNMTARASSQGHTWLHWVPSTEADFLEYRLHRGNAADFVPGTGNLLVAKPDTGYVDPGPAGGYYKLLALDVHGNASVAALLTPQDIVGVPGSPIPTTVWLALAGPNPIVGSAAFRISLPRAAFVSLFVLDAAGRRVRQLVSAELPAGEQTVYWDARDSDGRRVPSALYFVRLEAEGEIRTQTVAAVR